MAKTKYMFHRFNEEMKKLGGRTVTWKEFISGKPKSKVGRPRMDPALKKKSKKSLYNFDPEEKEPIIRPAATYDNKSPYDKYGL